MNKDKSLLREVLPALRILLMAALGAAAMLCVPPALSGHTELAWIILACLAGLLVLFVTRPKQLR